MRLGFNILKFTIINGKFRKQYFPILRCPEIMFYNNADIFKLID